MLKCSEQGGISNNSKMLFDKHYITVKNSPNQQQLIAKVLLKSFGRETVS